jgi:peroxin-5
MADCGAAGSTLDQTLGYFFGATSGTSSTGHPGFQAVQQAASAIVGHGVAGSTIGSALPNTAPQFLYVPCGTHQTSYTTNSRSIIQLTPQEQASSAIPEAAAILAAPFQSHCPQTLPALTNHTPPAHLMKQANQHSILNVPHSHLQYQNYAMSTTLMQQQHFMHLQKMQIELTMGMQKLQQKQQTHITAFNTVEENQLGSDSLSDGISYNQDDIMAANEGIVAGVDFNDLATAWHKASTETDTETDNTTDTTFNIQHFDRSSGVSIEELATAWAQAQAEYDELERTGLAEIEHTERHTNLWNHYTTDHLEDSDQFSLLGDPSRIMYVFRNNPNSAEARFGEADSDHHDWISDGMRFFKEGRLTLAIHAFEMELQCGDPNQAMAWRMLGQCHAENDMDRDAIACLEQAVDRDPYDSTALLALGVSYVNELNHMRSLNTLKAWVQHNPALVGLQLEPDIYAGPQRENSAAAEFDSVQRLLLEALRYSLSSSIDGSKAVEADVYEALGVVFNVSRDYDAAAESFRQALKYRPNDYQLWNKLGATLANGNRSAEALPAYHKALANKCRYARAWLNMAIAHSNLHQYHDAARCYLQTLSLNHDAQHCWNYLRIALACGERWDLIPFVAAQDLAAFTEHFDFEFFDAPTNVEAH